MPKTNEVFGKYDKDQPLFKMDDWETIKSNILNALLGIIPGSRAVYAEYKNPDISWKEYLDLMAEDFVPFYTNVAKPAAKGEGVDWENAAKEAALLGIPMPYTKFPKGHPRAGEVIPNNLKEGLGDAGWANAKSKWKHNQPNAKKLFADPSMMRYHADGSTGSGLSTRDRVGRTYDVVTQVEVPAGPYQVTNNGSLVQNRGGMATNTNTVRTTGGGNPLNGSQAWQGEMYPPGRSLRKDDLYGPFQWEDKYSRKLNDVIDKNELNWEYLINQTRPILYGKHAGKQLPKETAIEIALKQGRPDIAERIRLDDKPRVSVNGSEFHSIGSKHRGSKLSNEEFKDIGNRQVEKELRETFASLPEDPAIRYRFADYYGVPDLYQLWMSDPESWAKYKKDIRLTRQLREASNRANDRRYGRTIKR